MPGEDEPLGGAGTDGQAPIPRLVAFSGGRTTKTRGQFVDGTPDQRQPTLTVSIGLIV